MKNIKVQKQKGYLLIIAIAIIVIVGFFAAAAIYMFKSTRSTGMVHLASEQAFYVAQGGLEKAVRSLSASGTTEYVSCANIAANYTNKTINSTIDGTYSVSGYNYTPAPTAITADNGTTITLQNTTNFAPRGRIFVGQALEPIDYDSITGTTLNVASRVTPAGTYGAGTYVFQNQCTITSIGSVPAIDPISTQTVETNLSYGDESFLYNFVTTYVNYNKVCEWLGGEDVATSCSTLQCSGAYATNPNCSYGWLSLNVPGGTQNDISLSSFNDGFIVGDSSLVVHWDGVSWTKQNNAINGLSGTSYNLNGVSAVVYNQAWAVGDNRSNGTSVLLKWNGSTWAQDTITSDKRQDLNAVSVIKNSNGTMVGYAVGDNGAVYRYNGISWSPVTLASLTYADFTDVEVISPSEIWVIADDNVYKFNGVSTVTPTPLNSSCFNAQSIDMIDINNDGFADFGIIGAGGNKYGIFDTGTWTRDDISGGSSNDVAALMYRWGWSVGQGNNRGMSWNLSADSWVPCACTTQTGLQIGKINQHNFDVIFTPAMKKGKWYKVSN